MADVSLRQGLRIGDAGGGKVCHAVDEVVACALGGRICRPVADEDAAPAVWVQRSFGGICADGEKADAAYDGSGLRRVGETVLPQGFATFGGLKQGELAGQFGGFGGEGVFGIESAQVCGFAAAAAVIFAGQFDMIGFAVDYEIGRASCRERV